SAEGYTVTASAPRGRAAPATPAPPGRPRRDEPDRAPRRHDAVVRVALGVLPPLLRRALRGRVARARGPRERLVRRHDRRDARAADTLRRWMRALADHAGLAERP